MEDTRPPKRQRTIQKRNPYIDNEAAVDYDGPNEDSENEGASP